jgi:coatomer subunit beta
MASMERTCTLLVHFDKGTPALSNEIKEHLEGHDVEAKVDAMKKAIMLLLNGDSIPTLFITIVRYVLPSEDHTIQKLLLLYLEIIDKTDSRGKVLPEMILICEYIRGVTLRFLSRLMEAELIEPLIPSVLTNLEHRHAFVRRNAILAITAICKLPQGDHLIPDAPELIEKVLHQEQDQSALRNAFLMLFNCAQERAVHYLLTHLDNVASWGDTFQMVVLELIRKVCRTNPEVKGKYMKIIVSLLSSQHTAVMYESAGTLVSLSSAPTAIRAAANTYCELLQTQSDNNVKLIVLDRLQELKSSHREVMVEVIMDLLRALSSPNLDIRKKTLDIALDLITLRNIDEVVMTLKKEVVKTQNAELEKNGEYRQMLVQAIHSCALKFPEVASTVVHLLMDFLGDSNVASAIDVVCFVREIIETNAKLRESIMERLVDSFYQIRSSRVATCALWIIGEYSQSVREVEAGIAVVKQSLGELPFFTTAEEGDVVDAAASNSTPKAAPPQYASMASSKRPAILADGTYATQSASAATATPSPNAVVIGSSANLRSILLTGDFFLGAVVASTLTKLMLRYEEVQDNRVALNKAEAEILLYMVSMLRLGQSSALSHPIDDDAYDRITLCIKVLTEKDPLMTTVWLKNCRTSFAMMINDKLSREMEEKKSKAQDSYAQPDDLIDFYHLKRTKVCLQNAQILVGEVHIKMSSVTCTSILLFSLVMNVTYPSCLLECEHYTWTCDIIQGPLS